MAAQTRYLVRRGSQEVFIWTEALASRKDMDEVFAEDPKAALIKDTMPDPRRITLDELERMSKADLIIFGKLKLNLELSAELNKASMLDEIKLAIFSRPSEVTDDVKPPVTETRPMSTAAQARSQRGA